MQHYFDDPQGDDPYGRRRETGDRRGLAVLWVMAILGLALIGVAMAWGQG